MTDLEGANGRGRTVEVDEAAIERAALQFAVNFRSARKRKGLTQTEISNAAKVNQGHVSEVERGVCNPSLGVMLRLAAAIGEPLSYLLDHHVPSNDQTAPQESLRA